MNKLRLVALLFVILFQRVEAQRAQADVFPTTKGPLTVQPIVHASLVLSVPGLTVYADPTGGAANYTGLKAPDLILITDIHGDHFDINTLSGIRTSSTVLVAPQAVADKLPDSLKGKLLILNNGEKKTQSGITITAIPMYNLPETPDSRHTKGRGNGYILAIGGRNIYLSGDTQGIPEMRALKGIDIAFICMNLPYTMGIDEAADAVLAFKPKIVYPYHYRGSDVNAFKTKVETADKAIDVRLREWYPKKG